MLCNSELDSLGSSYQIFESEEDDVTVRFFFLDFERGRTLLFIKAVKFDVLRV